MLRKSDVEGEDTKEVLLVQARRKCLYSVQVKKIHLKSSCRKLNRENENKIQVEEGQIEGKDDVTTMRPIDWLNLEEKSTKVVWRLEEDETIEWETQVIKCAI